MTRDHFSGRDADGLSHCPYIQRCSSVADEYEYFCSPDSRATPPYSSMMELCYMAKLNEEWEYARDKGLIEVSLKSVQENHSNDPGLKCCRALEFYRTFVKRPASHCPQPSSAFEIELHDSDFSLCRNCVKHCEGFDVGNRARIFLNDKDFGQYPHLKNSSPRFSVTANTEEIYLRGDISALQVAVGTDIQGIPWENLPFTREVYRATRRRDSPHRTNSISSTSINGIMKDSKRSTEFCYFFQSTRRIECNIVHFQLRNLAWATSKQDVMVMDGSGILHWDAAARRKTSVLDLSGTSSAVGDGLANVQISTMIAKDDIVVAGGFCGEVVMKSLKEGKILHNKRITYDDNAITNAFDMYDSTIMVSSNDCVLRCFDVETFQKKSAFRFDTPVNHATRQPNNKMVCAGVDDKLVQVVDGDNGQTISRLDGHDDYSFATWWHPDGRLFATGSQDMTCRVWDVRQLSQSVRVLPAHCSPVRSIRFSECGKFMIMAEQRDFVHIFDVRDGFNSSQEIDIVGDIGGISLSPCNETLFIAVCDRVYSSLLEYSFVSSPHLDTDLSY